jgi:hypothetical protein
VTSAQPVEQVWVNHDDDLLDLTVTASDGTPATIHTTQHHPFWDVTQNGWVEAGNLRAGDQLRGLDGRGATVVGATIVAGAADMWDLTVAQDHDFLIDTVVASVVLVHNCPNMIGEDGPTIQSHTTIQNEEFRIDVENPNPGVRPGQMHLQPWRGGAKYMYDFEEGVFSGLPRAIAKRYAADIAEGVSKGLKYLKMIR